VGHIRVADLRSADQPGLQVAADVAALAVLDFGNFSTKVSQKKRRQRPLYFLSNLDNLDSFKWLGHFRSSIRDAFKRREY